jgi:UDP-N-acetylglucosamine 2-epimerase
VRNLAAEGIRNQVRLVGDLMFDTLQWALARDATRSDALLVELQLSRGDYMVCTVHRSANTDDAERLGQILGALRDIGEVIVFPVHPRTRAAMAHGGLPLPGNVRPVDPLGYAQMVALVSSARMILTDSGGLQKEAYWLGVPCITLRNETEWVETVATGWNVLAGCDRARVVSSVRTFSRPARRPPLYGEGGVAERCVELIGAL